MSFVPCVRYCSGGMTRFLWRFSPLFGWFCGDSGGVVMIMPQATLVFAFALPEPVLEGQMKDRTFYSKNARTRCLRQACAVSRLVEWWKDGMDSAN